MAATIVAAASIGCAGVNVSSYAERNGDLAAYRSYHWAPVEQRTTGDPRLDNNTFFHDRVQAEVDRHLARRGYVKAPEGGQDVTIRYQVFVSDQVDPNGADVKGRSCAEGDCQPYVYQMGRLTFELIDARSGQVVWHGWAEGRVDGVINNQQWMEQKIDDVVARIFDRLPRRE